MTQESFRADLLPGEHIVWSGRPAQGLLFTSRDWLMIPFSLFWCGFAIFWTSTVLLAHAPIFMVAWGSMFVCVGLFMVVGRFVLDAWLRSRTSYALTDRRVLIRRASPFANFAALGLDRLPDTNLQMKNDDRGTIRFGQPWTPGRRQMGGWIPSLDPAPQFIAIDGAQTVFQQIQRLSQPDRHALGAPGNPGQNDRSSASSPWK